jgi:hypothetical protein
MKPLAFALSGAEKGRDVEGGEGDITNVQSKSIWNCHNESPLNYEYILIKMKKVENLAMIINLDTIEHYVIFHKYLILLFSLWGNIIKNHVTCFTSDT